MKYFLHDTNAFNDDKISELFISYGYEGLGLFYTILERFGAQEKPIKIHVLKRQLQINKRLEKIWNFLVEIKLISCQNDEVFNERILSYSQKYQIRNEKNKERVRKFREQNSDNQQITDNGNALQEHYVTLTDPACNGGKEIKKVNKQSSAIDAAPPILNEGKVYELLRTSTKASIDDNIIKEQAKEFIKKYSGKTIGNLKALIDAWAENLNAGNVTTVVQMSQEETYNQKLQKAL